MVLRYLVWGAITIGITWLVVGCSYISYVDNDTLIRKGLVAADRGDVKEKTKLFYVPKQLGGLKVTHSLSGEEKEQVFLISREKSRIVAHTQIYDGENPYFQRAYMSVGGNPSDFVGMEMRFEDDHKKYFEKAYFNIGADRKKGMVGVQLRFIY